MEGKARHRSLVRKSTQCKVCLADSWLALLLRPQAEKAHVWSGTEVTPGAMQWSAPQHSLCCEMGPTLVSDSSFVGAALLTWSWILAGKNQHTYWSLNIGIDGKILSLSSPVLKSRIRSNFQCLRLPGHLPSQLFQACFRRGCPGLIQDLNSSYLQCIGTDIFIQPPLPKVVAFSTSVWIYFCCKGLNVKVQNKELRTSRLELCVAHSCVHT